MAVLVISYSRQDQPQVRAIVKLLRGAMREIERAVYWDEDLEAGDAWFAQITAAIDASPQLFVFWCHHASRSNQVGREVHYAFERGKRIVPVLLDDTPLPDVLTCVHGIDLRDAVRHNPFREFDPRRRFTPDRDSDAPERQNLIRRLLARTIASIVVFLVRWRVMTPVRSSRHDAVVASFATALDLPAPRDETTVR